jgi:hypothetical protein
MTTLLHLNQTLLDVQETLSRERRFGHDVAHNLLSGLKLVREGLDSLERDIKTYFEERDRAISCVLGSSQPYTTLIDDSNTAALEGKKSVSAD